MGKYVGKNALTAFWNGIKATFSSVAFSGQYSDLSNKPTVQNAVSGGTTESLVTTGEKYQWNKAVSTVANQGLTDTEKRNARINIGANVIEIEGVLYERFDYVQNGIPYTRLKEIS